jgi:general secretion pathway protein H
MRQAGFSLLELLVVIVIFAVMAGAAVLSVGAVREETAAEVESRRLTSLIRLASEEALVQGRDLGLEFFNDGYRFLAWDPDSRLWTLPAGDELLRPRPLPEALRIALVVEGQEVVLEDRESRRGQRQDQVAPQVAIMSSGDLTPFELFVAEEFDSDAWEIRASPQGEVELTAPGEDAR